MRKLCTCLFYGLCVFTIVFSLFWMALPNKKRMTRITLILEFLI